MTKKIYSMCMAVALLVAGVAMSGCKKDNNNPDQPKQVQTYKMSIQASKGTDQQANGPRRVLSLEGTTLNATWQAGERVTVYNETQNAELGGYLEAEESGASTQLTGELTGSIAVGDKLTLKYRSPDYATQKGTIEYISANCDYAVATDVEVVSVGGNTIYTTGTADFVNQQAIVKFTLKNEDGSATIAAKPLVIEVAGETYTVNPESATSEMFVALPGFEGQNVTLTATVGSDTYTYEKASATLTNGLYYTLTAEMTKQAAPAYKEYGPFSVSPTKKVNFSQGNLQYIKSTGKFEFMTNQYDIVETTGDVGDNYASQDVISLFGWATSNLNTPVANTNYLPTNTNPFYIYYGSGITTANVNWSDNENEYANYDWGANTGDLGTGWRTLTTAEWQYLFNTRTVNGGTGDGKSYTLGQSVNGTLGVVLYPDDYTGDAYTGSDWSTFEDAGCVFLPAAGSRAVTTVDLVGDCGGYWSSTSSVYNSEYALAYCVSFNGSNVDPAYSSMRFYGSSVRLVKNAN